MLTTSLPGSGRLTSRLGLGCARIVGGSDALQSRRIIEAALEIGIRHFDVAPSYGFGLAEAVLGSQIAGVSDATIATKSGITRPVAGQLLTWGRTFAKPLANAVPLVKSTLSAALRRTSEKVPTDALDFRQEVEESLRRLRRDRLDIFLLHEPAAVSPVVEERLANLLETGIIDTFGTGTGEPTSGAAFCGYVDQVRWSPVPPEHQVPLVIYHGVMRFALQRLTALGNSAEVSAGIRVFDLDPADPSSGAALLLSAILSSSDAIVLVSTRSPSKLASLSKGVAWEIVARRDSETTSVADALLRQVGG